MIRLNKPQQATAHPSPPYPLPTQNPLPQPELTNPDHSFSLTYHTHKAKHTDTRPLHLLSKSTFPVRLCDPLTIPQQQARFRSVSTIKKLNSDHLISNHRYIIRGTTNFHVALLPKDP